MLSSTKFSNLVYVALYFIETIQILYYSLLLVALNASSNSIFKTAFSILKYFQLVPLIQDYSD